MKKQKQSKSLAKKGVISILFSIFVLCPILVFILSYILPNFGIIATTIAFVLLVVLPMLIFQAKKL